MTFVERAAGVVYIRDASLAPVEVLAAVPAADGRWSAVSMGGESVRYWDVQAGPGSRPVLRPNRFAALRSVVVARGPNGDRVVAALGTAGAMWRWEAATGRLLGTTPRTQDFARWWADGPTRAPVTAVDVDGASVLLTGMADGSLRGWDPVTGAAVGEAWDGPAARSWALSSAVLEDGTPLVFSGGADGLVHRWNPRTGTRHGSPIERCGRAMAMTTVRLPDGRTLLCVASGQGRVHRRDVLSGEPVGPAIRTGWQARPLWPVCPVRLACLSTPSGGVVATCVDYRTVQLWDLVSGEHLADLPRGGRTEALAAAELPDGTPVILVGDDDGTVRSFHASTGTPVGDVFQPHGCAAGQVHAVPTGEGRVVLAVDSRSGMRRFDGRTGQPVGDPHRPWHVPGFGFATVALPGGHGTVVAGGDYGISRLDLSTGVIHEATPDEEPTTIWNVAAVPLPDGRVIVAGAGHDGNVYRWEVTTGRAVGQPLEGHSISVKAVATTTLPDGTPMIVSGCEAGEVRRWDASSGLPIGGPLPGEVGMVASLTVVCGDGYQLLVCVDFEGGLHRWDPDTGEPSGPTITIPCRASLLGTDVDSHGTPTVFLHIDDDEAGERVERWRVDTGTQLGGPWPANLRAVYRDEDRLRMILSDDDGTLTITPLPEAP